MESLDNILLIERSLSQKSIHYIEEFRMCGSIGTENNDCLDLGERRRTDP